MRAALAFLLVPATLFAADPDVRSGQSAAAAARPLAGLFGGSEPDAFRKAVAQGAEMRVFEGLPDPRTERALHEKERARGDLILLAGSAFYASPLPVGNEDLSGLRALFDPGNPFSPGGGGDPCGSFHADYALVWQVGDALHVALIGLGCQEIHATAPSIDVHRYIPPDVYARLQKILGKFSVNRPRATADTISLK